VEKLVKGFIRVLKGITTMQRNITLTEGKLGLCREKGEKDRVKAHVGII